MGACPVVVFNHNCVLREQKKRHRPPLPAVASAGRDPLIDPDFLNFVDVRACGTGISRGMKSRHSDRPPVPGPYHVLPNRAFWRLSHIATHFPVPADHRRTAP